MKARGQPILTMLNTIHQIVMTRIVKEQKEKEKWIGALCPRVEKLIMARQSLTGNYVTRFAGDYTYEVSTAEHAFVVNMGAQVCSCGMWEVSGILCVHAVCVCAMENKNPRNFVDQCFTRETFLRTYSHYLKPIGGPVFWPKDDADEILPPKVRVLPGRPKKKRRVSADEVREKAEMAAAGKAKGKKRKKGLEEVYKVSKKGQANHCKLCQARGHNKRSCPLKNVAENAGVEENADLLHSREPMSQPVAESTVGDGPPREQASSSQPVRRSRRLRRRNTTAN